MAGGPPSADISYPMPEAQSAISIAAPLDKEKIRAFLRKDLPNSRIEHEVDNIKTYLGIYKIANKTAKFLKDKGFKAWVLFPNFKYRKGLKFWQVRSYPPVSLKYLAVRSGVGTYGWSGNVGIPGIGAPIILGGIITDAKLDPTNPIPPEETFCNKCKLCEKVCPLRMFGGEEEGVKLGDYDFSFSKRNHLYRCFASCGGFTGLDKTGKWSTWSKGRFPYPETDKEVINVLAKSFTPKVLLNIKGEAEGYNVSNLRTDVGLSKQEYKTLLKGNKRGLKQLRNTTLTCGNCQLICWGDPKETAENFKMLTNSGCVIEENCEIKILPSDEAKKVYDAMGGYKLGLGHKILSWLAVKYLTRASKYFKRE